MMKSDGLRFEILRVGLRNEMRARRGIDIHVPQYVLDAGAKAGFGRNGEVGDVSIIDRPHVDHVAATPRGTRLNPDMGEDDVWMRARNRVPDRGFDLAKVLIGFDM